MRLTTAIAALLVGLCLFPAASLAQSSGNPGLDQYQENLPAAGGDRPSGPGGSGGGGSGGGAAQTGESSVSPSSAAALGKLGPDGKRAADLAEATAPKPVHPSAQSNGGSGGGTSATSSGTDDGPGLGWVLPVILVLSAAAAVAVAFVRRRGGSPPGPA